MCSKGGLLASKQWGCQMVGMLWKRWWLPVAMMVCLGLAVIELWPSVLQKGLGSYGWYQWMVMPDHWWVRLTGMIDHRWYRLALLTVMMGLVINVCHRMTSVFSIHRNEGGITWSQFAILMAIGVWIVGLILIFDVFDTEKNTRYAAAVGVAGTLLSWIFQDTIKGVVAFIHLRWNHLLSIDDWIKIPEHGVDGTVQRVTLTTVTLYNWDTTTSTVPTSMLYANHFCNFQKMMEGKTHGRRLYTTFLLDTNWFHTLSAAEAEELKQHQTITAYLPEREITEGRTNAQLFRLYLFHWLMNHPHISQQPRLLVRWLEQKECGMPLQVYAFITETTLVAYERQQSLIVEHIMESLEWFGLRLYQSPSAFDVSNSNIFLTSQPASYKKEIPS